MPNATHPDPCVLVIFGASGDLTRRKLVPALYELDRQRALPDKLVLLGVSRTELSDGAFRDRLRESAAEHAARFDDDSWARFANRIYYQASDATKGEAHGPLNKRIQELGAPIAREGGRPNVLYYLSVAPSLYEPIIDAIGDGGMVDEGKRWCAIDPSRVAWQRIIVEKPFGNDLESARRLNQTLGRVFEESATFRIDHYLGKELVQNVLVMRFANRIFEPIWNREHVDHVQVTAAETIGVGSRAANFYDQTGAVRDMIQSHLVQVLALVAIEPPSSYIAPAIMAEKIKLLKSVRPIEAHRIPRSAVLGRYGAGPDGPAYVQEEGVDPARRTETYGAIRFEFDTWRWSGVPFYLRSGKRMAHKRTEVVVQFKRPPANVFRTLSDRTAVCPPNRLVIRIAPDEGVSLEIEGKTPGSGLEIETARLDLNYVEHFGGEPVEAYGPLLLDAMRGDRALYKHRDEVEGAWELAEPFLQNAELRERIETYSPGSWGPAGADELLAMEGRAWRQPREGEP